MNFDGINGIIYEEGRPWNCADNCVPKLLRRAASLGTRRMGLMRRIGLIALGSQRKIKFRGEQETFPSETWERGKGRHSERCALN